MVDFSNNYEKIYAIINIEIKNYTVGANETTGL